MPASKLLSILSKTPGLSTPINRIAIDRLASATAPRPRPFTLWSPDAWQTDTYGPITDYVSWPSLTDRNFSGRHLPPASQSYVDALPPDQSKDGQTWGPITQLFARNQSFKPSRSSVLFTFFAQWFTDSFLRIDPNDRRRNTSNHEIDLCQIYGLDEATARILRLHQGGLLRHQLLQDDEYLMPLFQKTSGGDLEIRPEFTGLPYLHKLDVLFPNLSNDRKARLYATGLERGNSTIGYTAISTLFMREHNRIARVLLKNNPSWDDEHLFQTARLINIALLLKIIIEDYINHIAGKQIFKVDIGFAEEQSWYRTNWIAVEFDILYRWHGLVPDQIDIQGKRYTPNDYRNNNALLEEYGLHQTIDYLSKNRAGKIGLKNTPDFLLGAEFQSIKMGRDFRLKSFNQYRECFGLERLSSFDALTSDHSLAADLKSLYGNIDRVEFVIGLFAEDPADTALSGELLTTMVACDAFTQALTNPVLSKYIFKAEYLTDYGIELIKQTHSLQQIVDRNLGHHDTAPKAVFNCRE